MTFSQSLEFGNSTFMKLESDVNHAINNGDKRENNDLDVILESPTSKLTNKSTGLSLSRNKTRILLPVTQNLKKTEDVLNSQKFRRSKSDSTLSTVIGENKQNALDNYSQFFQSDFSFEYNGTNNKQNSIGLKSSSVLRVSQIAAAFEDDKESTKVESEYQDIDINNSFEKPIFSDDLKGLLETEEYENISRDQLPLLAIAENGDENLNEPVEILHDISSFICPPNYNKTLREELLCKELEESHKVLQEVEEPRERLSERNLSLSRMSPHKFKFTQEETSVLKRSKKIKLSNTQLKSIQVIEKTSAVKSNEVPINNLEALKCLKAWNLPLSILAEYERKGIKKMFDWQIQCLSNPKVLFEHCNLVYSAPTSAGKTLVSEILLLKTVIERGKKVLLILPFISVVREKMFYLQDLLTAAGYRVEGFFGGYTPPGGFDSINVAICTIEKANSIVNKLLEQDKLNEIGTVVVDEVHLISDPGRGYILELLLAKILYMSRKYELQIQIVTMSATLANVELLKKWLHAEMYVTNLRPVALKEMIKIGNIIYDNSLNVIRSVTDRCANIREPFPALQNDSDHVAQLCIETLIDDCSVLVFCPSKDWCESLATQLAGTIHSLGKQCGELGTRLKSKINRKDINDLKQQLRDIPTGLDAVLDKCITYGCSFHHAGLTTEERDIVEAGFKSGVLKVIVATSTLSSGVNLPARRVLIRSPLFGGKQMSSLTYRQMIGRAGRTGKDILGESILICTESNARIGKELINTDLKPLRSCLDFDSSTHLKRALLEVISSGVASSKEDIDNFVNCTLLNVQKQLARETEENQEKSPDNEYIDGALDFLVEYEFIRLQKKEETQEQYYVATRLGNACLASSLPPTDGLILFAELQKSRRCFVLESELHAVYLVTPYSVCYQLQDLDWLLFLDMWEKLSPAMKKVGELVGVKESFLVRAMRGQTKLDYKLMQIHKRFYIALALQELVNETPINIVAFKYKCTRGMLQSLQQMSSTFAGIVTSFCNSLQWDTLSLIVSQFKERLYFGIHRDLIDLMRLPDLNHRRARILFDAGITSLVELANADILCIEKMLYNAFSFDSAKKHDNENDFEAAQRNEARNFVITGKAGLNVADAARLLVLEARKFVQYEIGVGNIKWTQNVTDTTGEDVNDKNAMHMSYEETKVKSQETKKVPNEMKNITLENKIGDNKDVIKSKQQKLPNGHQLTITKYQSNCHLIQSTAVVKKTNQREVPTNQKIAKENEFNKQQSEGSLNDSNEDNPKPPNSLGNDKKAEVHKNSVSVGGENVGAAVCKRKAIEDSNKSLDVTPPKTKKGPKENESKLKPTKEIATEGPSLIVQYNKMIDSEDNPSTSKKAQRLLRAKQLSELKKQEWRKRRDVEQNTPETKTRTLNGKTETPNVVNKNVQTSYKSTAKTTMAPKNAKNSPKSVCIKENPDTPKLLRRSPRNHLISLNTIGEHSNRKSKKNLKILNNDLFENEESFTINTAIKEALKEADNFKEPAVPQCMKMNSPEEEIPSSQQQVEAVSIRNVKTPQSSRFLRSLRATQKIQSPKTKTENALELLSSTSIEFSDFSTENSLLKNPIQLNASHILSCSKFDTEPSSFKSLDIIDICGDQQLFKGAFKEFMAHKRLGFCLGIQKQCGKRKPLIGSNLLLNQVTASERKNDEAMSYEFEIDDASYLAGIGFCISENIVYYMNMQQDNGSCKSLTAEIKCQYLRMLLKSQQHTLLVYEAKEQIKILSKILKADGDIHIAIEDPKVANWLLQPDRNHNLYNLAQQFAPECSSLVKLCGHGRGYNSYGLDSDSAILAKVRSSIEACVTVHILKGQIENLERIGSGQLQKFFTELEMPLQMSLCNMENFGFPVSSEALHKLFQQFVDCMKKLEAKIYEMHGSKFNLGSSSAVARVLGLHRKSNGRISTCKQILEKIDSPISQMIITYRKLNATLTKNIQPLLKCVQNERIHGQSISFTSTGRISMNEPNLQNVAKDFDVVIESERKVISCRSAFFPADAKRCFISADFCQLEMRILAHLSQDPSLLHAIKSDIDLFVAIAARWNKISESSVTEQLRNATKQICYGIVYGMGMRTLAEALKCTEQEATLVSEQFHSAYPGIRLYIEKVVKFARSNAYVETITGRRRYLEHICSDERLIQSQAERQAINSTIQGSAADIAKSAILRMEKNIVKYHDKLGLDPQSVRLVLHLHDELIFEVPEEKAKKIAKVLCLTMENCVKLNVPLKVKLKIGKSWGELKEIKL